MNSETFPHGEPNTAFFKRTTNTQGVRHCEERSNLIERITNNAGVKFQQIPDYFSLRSKSPESPHKKSRINYDAAFFIIL